MSGQDHSAHVYAYYLHLAKGRVNRAAAIAGMTVHSFQYHIRKIGLSYRKFRPEMCSCGPARKKNCNFCRKINRERMRRIYRPVSRAAKALGRKLKIVSLPTPDARIREMQMVRRVLSEPFKPSRVTWLELSAGRSNS